MSELDKLQTTIRKNDWKINEIPKEYTYSILNWAIKTRDETVKTGWPPNPNIDTLIAKLKLNGSQH